MSNVPAQDRNAGPDRRLLGLAVALGRRNLGLTWPNPSVGAVIVAPDNRIIAQGITQPGGRPHAEVVALAAADEAARGATLYVSLEPCSHHGHTPPCADAIVAAGIRRVFSAMGDPDGRVAGRGYAILKAAGIEVATDSGSAAAVCHRGHVMRITAERPWVTLKLARTPDGVAGHRSGPRLLITGEGVRARTHILRAKADAIMVGVATLEADDPRLDVRLPGLGERRPVRIVVDSRLRLPVAARVAKGAREQPTWAICSEAASREREARLADLGVEVVRMPQDALGQVDLSAALNHLAKRGLTTILCEGGPTLAEALAERDLIDDIVLLTGPPSNLASEPFQAIPALGPRLSEALGSRFERRSRDEVGPDLVEMFERITPCSPVS